MSCVNSKDRTLAPLQRASAVLGTPENSSIPCIKCKNKLAFRESKSTSRVFAPSSATQQVGLARSCQRAGAPRAGIAECGPQGLREEWIMLYWTIAIKQN